MQLVLMVFQGLFIVVFGMCYRLKEVQEFFIGIRPPGQVAAALITLILKVTNPKSFSESQPICLTNFLAKVITRLPAT